MDVTPSRMAGHTENQPEYRRQTIISNVLSLQASRVLRFASQPVKGASRLVKGAPLRYAARYAAQALDNLNP